MQTLLLDNVKILKEKDKPKNSKSELTNFFQIFFDFNSL